MADWLSYTIEENPQAVRELVAKKFNVTPQQDDSLQYRQVMLLIGKYGPKKVISEFIKIHPDRDMFETKCSCKKRKSFFRNSDDTTCDDLFNKIKTLQEELASGRFTEDVLQQKQDELTKLSDELKEKACQPKSSSNDIIAKLKALDKQYNLKLIGITALVTYIIVKNA